MSASTVKKSKPNNKNKEKEVKKVPIKTKKENNVSTKSISVPVMRCVTQLKFLLNNVPINKIKLYEQNNKPYFSTEKEFITKIKEVKPTDKESIRTEFNKWKANDTNNIITKTIQKYRKEKYRISGPAAKHIAQILEIIIRELLTYGIKIYTSTANKAKSPKLLVKDYTNITEDDISIFPLISGLKILEDIKNSKPAVTVEKKESTETIDDSNGEEDKKNKEKKGTPTYRMVIYNIFTQLKPTQKLHCSVPCKQFISDILMEFVERLQFYLAELVGTTAQASTINEKHVLSACRLMFYSVYRNLDEYSKFATTLEEMYQSKYVKDKK